eukprot:TRINITY_DN79205_c0_g1_i1.p2 TRINITY_DN79205_c0_g1~~TRINITY_DN79205_c0_g1_i1.p2  ORF type:complete len:79 (-),score=7.35 TRINITY_DN79205_c0_g1_i1:104-340(-)
MKVTDKQNTHTRNNMHVTVNPIIPPTVCPVVTSIESSEELDRGEGEPPGNVNGVGLFGERNSSSGNFATTVRFNPLGL